MKKRELISFIANDSVLPRKSGVSQEPLKNSVRFRSPKSMKVKMDLPDGTSVYGMGILKGVTLIVGGRYHGKSTLLEVLQGGVYNYIAGDGREYVFSDNTSVKIRAEDGRSIAQTDISMVINNLSNKMDTKCFNTQNASRSTSQAANVVEAIEMRCKVLLIDEDTSATNFMIRDDLMQMVISKDKELITPYIDRVRDLYDYIGVSTVLVIGSLGEYFNKADTILQLEDYNVYDITNKVKDITRKYKYQSQEIIREKVIIPNFSRKFHQYKGWIEDPIRLKINGKNTVSIDKDSINTRYLEQLVDEEQLRMIGYLFAYMNHFVFDSNTNLQNAVENVFRLLNNDGLREIFENKMIPCNLAIPRKQELFMCLNRFRKITN